MDGLKALPSAQREIELAARLAVSRDSLVAFRSALLASPGDVTPMEAHHRWSDIILRGDKNFAIEAFRESAKTQIALRANLLHALTFPSPKRSFIVIIRATKELAAALLRETSREWQARPELMMQADGLPDIVEDSGNAFQVRYRPGQQVRIAAFGKGGAIRGLSWGAKRPDLIVCDDIQDLDDVSSETVCESDWKWFMSDIYFLGHESRIFMIGNNLGERSIIERMIKDADVWGFEAERVPKMTQDNDGEWRSSWPARYSVEAILEQKEAFARKGMSDVWYREMLCEARSPGQQRFRRDMFRYYDPRTLRRDELSVYMTVDLASSKAASADYSVCCVIGVTPEGMWQVLDCWYGRVTPVEHMDEIFRLVQKWRPISVGIEKVQYQAAMLAFLQKEMPRRNVFFNIAPLIAGAKKEQRIDVLQPRFAVGGVWFPVGAPWLQEMEGELLAFPTGQHDDLIDALAYAEQIASAPVTGYARADIEIPAFGSM